MDCNLRISRLQTRKVELQKARLPIDSTIHLYALKIFSCCSSYCRRTLKQYAEYLSVTRELKQLQTWKKLGFSENAEHSQIKKLFESRLIWWITGFQSVSDQEKENNPIQVEKGNIYIKKEGKMVPVHELDLRWEKIEDCFIDSKGKKWLYFSKEGLVQLEKNEYSADDMRPIMQLSKEDMANVLKQGAKFYDPVRHPDPKPQEEKVCAIQFITRPNPFALENIPVLRRIMKDVPHHVAMRVIDKDGNVYSTSLSIKPDDAQDYNLVDPNTLKVRNGAIARIDWEEFLAKKHGEVITTVPLSQKSYDSVFNHLKEHQRRHLRFSATKQNCVKMGANTAEVIGEKITCDIKMKHVFFKFAPTVSDVPCFGKTFSKIGRRIVHKLDQVFPEWIKKIFIGLAKIIYYPIDIATSFLMNLVLVCVGHAKANKETTATKNESYNKEKMQNFKRNVNTPFHLFDPESETFFHAGLFTDWQLDQGSTYVFPPCKEGSKLNFFPKETDNEKARARLENVYQKMGTARRAIVNHLKTKQVTNNPKLYQELFSAVKQSHMLKFREALLKIARENNDTRLEKSAYKLHFFSKWNTALHIF